MAGKTVLITGTTSGVGRSLLEHYSKAGWTVVSINRRECNELSSAFPAVQCHVLNIESYDEVKSLLSTLISQGRRPDLFVLNAGINKADNLEGEFDYRTFQEVLNLNLMGTLSFVAAANELRIKNVTYVGISSTSNIVPNPGHMGYYLSKFGIRKTFEFLQKNNPDNSYKSVVLGPIHTNIMRHFEGPTGIQRKLYNFLAGTVDPLAPAIARFAESRKTVLYYPLSVCVFYWFVKWGLKLVPFVYSGTRRSSEKLADPTV